MGRGLGRKFRVTGKHALRERLLISCEMFRIVAVHRVSLVVDSTPHLVSMMTNSDVALGISESPGDSGFALRCVVVWMF